MSNNKKVEKDINEKGVSHATISWFPGHMAKTNRLISESLKEVDIVIELIDARIPRSSRNPNIAKLTQTKPSLLILTKSSLADSSVTDEWISYYSKNGQNAIAIDSITGEGFSRLVPTIKKILSEKTVKYIEKGMSGRTLKAMFLGIPNVGKSTMINKICGQKKAKVENRPGVTLNKQWINTNIGLTLMDMPGVLWPKFDSKIAGENLSITGAIKDSILDIETIATILCSRLKNRYINLLCDRYKLSKEEIDSCEIDYDLLLLIGKKRGFLVSGGEIDSERTASMLLEEFRNNKIGRISLETPEDI